MSLERIGTMQHAAAITSTPRPPDVFGFVDYRAFLRTYYESNKREHGLSYRGFSRLAKLRSPNYLKLIIDGDRRLSLRMADRFAKACGLEGEEARYFQSLVAFEQARSVEERNRAYLRMKRIRRYRRERELDLAQDQYHSHWYYPAIRELVTVDDFEEDPEWISRQLKPRVRPTDAAEALSTLQKLGFLVRDDQGRLQQATPTVTTGPEMRSLHLANFHRAMIQHGAEALDRVEPAQRDISGITLAVGNDGIARLRRAVQRFRRELLDLAELEEHPTQVVQMNFQLFPLSERTSKDGEK